MALDSLGRYSTTHKAWDHVGNMIPVVEYSEGIRPHGEFQPAPWLPVQFYDKHFEEWFVIMPGKVLAFDTNGDLMPAQYALNTGTIVYTQNDVDAGVIDITTGVALTATATYNVTDVDGSTEDFMGVSGKALRGSGTEGPQGPCGVAPYAFWQWAGDASAYDDGFNPVGYRLHNHNLQHRVAVLCDYVLEVPLVPAAASVEAVTETSNAANISTMVALTYLPVASNTLRTAMVWAEGVGAPADVATRFANQMATAAEVLALGDWHINLVTGIVTVYSASSIGATDYTLVYYHYASAPTTVSKFSSAVGNLFAGDFVKCNGDSNFALATPNKTGEANSTAFADGWNEIVGQVLEVEDQTGKDLLDRVRTSFDSLATNAAGSLPAYAGQMDQMPGSATGGYSDKIHYAGAANLVVRINLISR